MAITLMGVVKEKYLDTEIDSLVLHFADTKEECFVEEFDVPEEYQYMILMSKSDKRAHPAWIEIVNPEEVLKDGKAPLPEVDEVIIGERILSLRETIKECI